MLYHDLNNIWKETALRNKSTSTQSNCIAGISGKADIANLWKDHYCSLLNSSRNIADKDVACTSFKKMCLNHGMHVSVTISIRSPPRPY